MKKKMTLWLAVSSVLLILVSAAGVVYKIIPDKVTSLLSVLGLSWNFPIYWVAFLTTIAMVITFEQLMVYYTKKENTDFQKTENK